MAARHFSGEVPLSLQGAGPQGGKDYRGRHLAAQSAGQDTEAEPDIQTPLQASPTDDGEADDWARTRVDELFEELSAEMFGSPAQDGATSLPERPDVFPELDEPLGPTRETGRDAFQEHDGQRMAEEQVMERAHRERLAAGAYERRSPSAPPPAGVTSVRAKRRPLGLFARIGEHVARLLRLDER